MTETKQTLNPQVKLIKIGVRDLREVHLYPFTLGDQFKFSDIITDAMKEFTASDLLSQTSAEMSAEESFELNAKIINFVLEIIQKHLPELISIITCEELKSIDEITNTQFMEIVEYVFDINYGEPSKNAKSLLTRAKNIFQLRKSSVSSVNVMDTESKTSTDEISAQEA